VIDGIKAILSENLDAVRANQLIDFELPAKVSVCSGEVKTQKFPIARYKGLTLTDKGSIIEVKGSIHKMFNQGIHNYDSFGLSSIHLALYELADKLSILTQHAKLKNIEFGVNLKIGIGSGSILNSIIFHKSKKFTYREERNMKYMECCHGQYYIKVYDKGLQHGLDYQVLRFEVKYIKMEKINAMGIKYLSDILNPKKLERLQEELFRVFDEILMGDISSKPEGLTVKEQLLFANGHNSSYWDAHLPRTSDFEGGASDKRYRAEKTSYYRRMRKFKNLLAKTGADKKQKLVRQQIEIESNTLLVNAKNKSHNIEKCVKLTKTNSYKENLTLCQIDQNDNHPEKSQIDPLLYSDNNVQQDNPQIKKCVVTGLDISMQKDDSKFLCTTGINYYMDNAPNVYRELMRRLSDKWKDAPHEKQIQEIHHSIRNEYFNKIHNTRRMIHKLNSQPSLFNQNELISKEKFAIAGITG